MNKHANQTTLRVREPEFSAITEIVDSRTDLFDFEKINSKTYVLTFKSIEKAEELDEMIKYQLTYRGFNIDYEPNEFGRICEYLIDKFYAILLTKI